jgi:hypothetical protein
MRWTDNNSYLAGSVISKAVMSVSPTASNQQPLPRIYTTSPYYKGSTSTLWAGASMTNAGATARPDLVTNVGTYSSGGFKNGLVSFNSGKVYKWNVTGAFSSVSVNPPSPPYYYALGLTYNPTPRTMYWNGPVAPKTGEYRGVPFYNYNGGSGGQKPTLTLTYTAYSKYPFGLSIQTPPVLDAVHHTVYVANCNQLFALDYSSEIAFTDSDTDPTTGAYLNKYTKFNEAALGVVSGSGGGTYNAKANFNFNTSAAMLNFNASALYMLSAYPSGFSGSVPTGWNTALSKFTLPLSASGVGTKLVSPGPATVSAVPDMPISWLTSANMYPNSGSDALLLDPYANASSTGGGLYYGLGNGKVYQYDP